MQLRKYLPRMIGFWIEVNELKKTTSLELPRFSFLFRWKATMSFIFNWSYAFWPYLSTLEIRQIIKKIPKFCLIYKLLPPNSTKRHWIFSTNYGDWDFLSFMCIIQQVIIQTQCVTQNKLELLSRASFPLYSFNF